MLHPDQVVKLLVNPQHFALQVPIEMLLRHKPRHTSGGFQGDFRCAGRRAHIWATTAVHLGHFRRLRWGAWDCRAA